jgi:type II secretory pathway pseudopilin PulG
MMRSVTTILLFTMISALGCESRDAAKRRAVKNNLKQIKLAIEAYHSQQRQSAAQQQAADTNSNSFSHVIATETEYYTTGPQQGRPPDGKFPAGTKVIILQEAGSYTQIRSKDGIEAYVSSDAIKECDK